MNKLRKSIIALMIFFTIFLNFSPMIYARGSSGGHASSSHSTSRSVSTPKSSSGSTTSSHSVTTPKTSSVSPKGNTYTTNHNTSTGRTEVSHSKVSPKNSSNTNRTTVINNNPTYYSAYRPDYGYSLTNSIFQYYMLSEIFSGKDTITEQDIAKALEERGYTKEETDQIMDEAQSEESMNAPMSEAVKWTIIIIVILLAIFIIAMLIYSYYVY
jgi:cobalamin biosynthesis Mg chelatase CobN